MDLYSALTRENFVLVFQYLTPRDILNLMSTSKKISKDQTINQNVEHAWKDLCKKLCQVSDRTIKNHKHSMAHLFMSLYNKLQVPEGKYSGKFDVVYGKASNNQLAAWILLGHKSSCLLKEVNVQGTTYCKVELRICVQNRSVKPVTFDTESNPILVYSLPSEDSKESTPDIFEEQETKFLSYNGLILETKSSTIELKMFDFCVISCHLLCPEHVRTEPDFLTMIEKIFIKSNNTSLVVKLDSEEEIWDHFNMLPSGLIVLKEQPINSW